jgi:SAM-dependent methyltransferase
VLEPLGVPPSHLWQGNVLNPNSFRPPGGGGPDRFEAVLCIGVLPHIPPADDETVLRNLGRVVAPGGLAVLEARNQLFSLFTLNRYTYQFFVEELLRLPEVKQGYEHPAGGWELLEEGLKQRFRLDLPPLRRGQAGEPGYDEVLSRQHNPLVLQQQFAAAGFSNIEVLFYHYHALPPMFEAQMPEVFRRASLALENPRDWRGYFMASAFLLSGRRT